MDPPLLIAIWIHLVYYY